MSSLLAIIAGEYFASVTCVGGILQVMLALFASLPYFSVSFSLFSICQSLSLAFGAADWLWKESWHAF